MRVSPTLLLTAVAALSCGADDPMGPIGTTLTGPPAQNVQELSDRLDQLRELLRIPAMSVAIARGDQVVWAEGFGFADLERDVAATPTTGYHAASITKTFASTVIMQLVEQGLLDLDEPASTFGIDVEANGTVLVRHLFTHTSEGVPGSAFAYNGNRFGLLDAVVSGASGRSFGELLVERILEPLSLQGTAPNPGDVANFAHTGFDRGQFISNMAKAYDPDGDREIDYPDLFNSAAGLVSTVLDVAAYSIAIDQDRFLLPATKDLVFTPNVTATGLTTPYGLGWFVQWVEDVKVVWHYGYWTGNSSLLLKVPEMDLAFVAMANTEMLSAPYDLGAGDIMTSALAREFVNGFVIGTGQLPQ